MANELKMEQHQAIIGLWRQGWSYRRIASELHIDRETVSRHVKAAGGLAGPEPTGPPTPCGSNATIVIAGSTGPATGASDSEDPCSVEPGSGSAAESAGSNAAIVIAGATAPRQPLPGDCAVGRRSLSASFGELITEGLDKGLTAQRIWQDLRDEHGFAGGYLSVQRFVRRLRGITPLPFRRMECAPGEEAQIDFGKGGSIVKADGKRSRPHLFRIVLSHSRKAYSEAVPRQKTELFLRCLENAFWSFGGVPRTLVPDNLKAAVLQADWFDPELNPKIVSFCEHYGTVLLPTRPRMPEAQGEDRARRGLCTVQRGQGADVCQSRRAQRVPPRLGIEHRRHAHPRDDAPAGGRGVRTREAGAAAPAGRTLPMLRGRQADRQPRWACGGGQGLLLGAAGVRRAYALGPVGR